MMRGALNVEMAGIASRIDMLETCALSSRAAARGSISRRMLRIF